MFILKTFITLLVFLFSTTLVYAAVWYDKLPESGEYAPVQTEINKQRDFENVNSGEPGPLDFSSEEDSEEIVTEENVDNKSLTSEISTNKSLGSASLYWLALTGGILVIIGLAVFVYISRKKRSK